MSIFDIFKSLEKEQTTTPISYIICGLGNPGTKYESTRHNCGFMAADTICEEKSVEAKKLKFKSLTTEVTLGGTRCLIMKPTTFMNKSGEAVAEAMNFYKLPPEKLLVIFDDVSLDVGKMRIRQKGSDGGHNGIKSIILNINSDAFPRIKIGVGKKPRPDYDLADWVLSHFTKDEGALLEAVFKNAAEAAEMIANGKISEAMNKFN